MTLVQCFSIINATHIIISQRKYRKLFFPPKLVSYGNVDESREFVIKTQCNSLKEDCTMERDGERVRKRERAWQKAWYRNGIHSVCAQELSANVGWRRWMHTARTNMKLQQMCPRMGYSHWFIVRITHRAYKHWPICTLVYLINICTENVQ